MSQLSPLTHDPPFLPALSQAQRRLSQRLIDFKFECIGNRQTDDELVIAGSLKEFGKLIGAIEDEKDRMVRNKRAEGFADLFLAFRSGRYGRLGQ
jgi:hypothetical protein